MNARVVSQEAARDFISETQTAPSMMNKRRKLFGFTPLIRSALGLLLIASFIGCDKKSDTIAQAEQADRKAGIAAPGIEEVKAIAEEGFIYGLPLVMSYTANYEFWFDQTSGQYKCPIGQLFNERRVFTDKDTAVVTPNSDTPYSFGFVDLRAEPSVISVPAVEKERYYSVMLCDLNTFNYGYIGSRATGSEAGDYLIAGPDWKGETPAGIKKVFHPTTQFSIILFRTQLFGADDMPNVTKIQDAYKLQPLSAFLKQTAPPAAPALDWPKANAELAKTNFFEYLDFVLTLAPAGPEEKGIRAKLARIGIGPGKTFNFKDLSLEHKAAVLLGVKAGEKKMEEKVAAMGKKINGWNDLDNKSVDVITANPKTSGGARWNFLGLWGSVTQTGGTEAKAKSFITNVYRNVDVLPKDAREATDTFVKRRKGDVLLNYENEAILARKTGEWTTPYKVPSPNILIEGPIAVVDQNVDKHGTRKVAEAFAKYLFSPTAQKIFVDEGFRPVTPAGKAYAAGKFPEVQTFKVVDLGGWKAVSKKFFDKGGLWDQIFSQSR